MAQHDADEPADSGEESMLERHHRLTVWIPWTVILLGVWLATAPFLLGHLNEDLWAQPSGGRGVWFSDATHDEWRAQLMTRSDVVSGLALVVLGWRMLRPDRPISWWLACGVGAWLLFAPVVFSSPTSAAFTNDSIVGLLVIALGFGGGTQRVLDSQMSHSWPISEPARGRRGGGDGTARARLGAPRRP